MNAGTPRGRWLVTRTRRPDAVADLYCFAHAGGSPGEYVRFGDELPELEVHGIQLPGRAARHAEPPVTGMPELVDAVVAVLEPQRPFAFFGHSLGGLVAFEVTRALRRLGRPLPTRLLLSSSPPPPHPRAATTVHTLPDDELLAEVERRWGALPAQVHEDAALRAMVLGTFRADLRIFETYPFEPGPPLQIPLTVFAGEQERETLRVENWREHTEGPFETVHLPGGHFYFRAPDQRHRLLARIRGLLVEEPSGGTVHVRAGAHRVVAVTAPVPPYRAFAVGETDEDLAKALQREREKARHELRQAAGQAVTGGVPTGPGGAPAARRGAPTGPGAAPQRPDGRPPAIAFVFPGQGSQYGRMGLALAHDLPLFRAELDRCLDLLHSAAGMDLRPVLQDATGAGLRQTEAAQPALFALEYALARTLIALGVRPAAMIGHSLGEYVAATLAGVMELPDALRFVALRARLMQQAPPGAMLAVPLPEHALAPCLTEGTDLATVNAPDSCVLAGTEEAIARVEERLAGAGTPGRRLRVSHAFHSRMMDGCVDRLREAAAGIGLRPPAERFVSGVTGAWITAEQATDPDYWARHLRQTVRFSDAVATLLADAPGVLLETGPGPALTGLVKRRSDLPPGTTALSSLPHPGARTPETAGLLTTLGTLWTAGAPVDWAALGAVPGDRPTIPLAA
ncbi:acyltransferase domain-containing protein [Streptomyces sp. NPDC003753]